MDHDVLGIRRLGRAGEVEAAVLHGLAVHDHDLVVLDPHGGVHAHGNSVGGQKVGDAVATASLWVVLFVDNYPHVHAALLRIDERLADRVRCQPVGGESYRLARFADEAHRGCRASAVWRKRHLHRALGRQGGRLRSLQAAA